MTIQFSRHAQRRIKLYKIPLDEVASFVEDSDHAQGHHEVVRPLPGFAVPIKVVYEVEGETITVVTAYPLKRGRSQ